ncbi:unnamed protein product [Owenia fusiformis]|uniref:Uncharacterized protein n=1 Tax=Owenia fusiformis TaxID=6347 RepID=A0A8J1T5S2_OWEFU|nr:unnamed protein product [Owenia fusiformis]
MAHKKKAAAVVLKRNGSTDSAEVSFMRSLLMGTEPPAALVPKKTIVLHTTKASTIDLPIKADAPYNWRQRIKDRAAKQVSETGDCIEIKGDDLNRVSPTSRLAAVKHALKHEQMEVAQTRVTSIGILKCDRCPFSTILQDKFKEHMVNEHGGQVDELDKFLLSPKDLHQNAAIGNFNRHNLETVRNLAQRRTSMSPTEEYVNFREAIRRTGRYRFISECDPTKKTDACSSLVKDLLLNGKSRSGPKPAIFIKSEKVKREGQQTLDSNTTPSLGLNSWLFSPPNNGSRSPSVWSSASSPGHPWDPHRERTLSTGSNDIFGLNYNTPVIDDPMYKPNSPMYPITQTLDSHPRPLDLTYGLPMKREMLSPELDTSSENSGPIMRNKDPTLYSSSSMKSDDELSVRSGVSVKSSVSVESSGRPTSLSGLSSPKRYMKPTKRFLERSTNDSGIALDDSDSDEPPRKISPMSEFSDISYNSASVQCDIEPVSPKSDFHESRLSRSPNIIEPVSIKCIHCDIVFNDEVLFSIHKGCHSHNDPFTCNFCGLPCQNKYSFYTHIMRGHHVH